MTTLRQDPTTNEWVIVAPERADRPFPERTPRPPMPSQDPGCPFCPGNEHMTPPERARAPRDGAWQIRAFDNLYPALVHEGSTDRFGEPPLREMAGVGRHEVVVESPRHDERLDEMPLERIATLLQVWRDRYLALAEGPAIKAVIVFKNFGERAGTSLVHPHSQIVATPVLPPDYLHRYAVATRYYDDTGRCAYVDLIERELESGARVVAERDGVVAVAPFASAVPFETWLAPRRHQTSFGSLDAADVTPVAELIRDVVGALRRSARDPDYNLIVQSAPVGEEAKPFFQWHLRLLPRITTDAGFELGTGMSINSVPPERAAAMLREALATVSVA